MFEIAKRILLNNEKNPNSSPLLIVLNENSGRRNSIHKCLRARIFLPSNLFEELTFCFRIGLFTANSDDVRFYDINLNQRQKPESVLINSLILTCYVSHFYSLVSVFPYFRGQLGARYILVP